MVPGFSYIDHFKIRMFTYKTSNLIHKSLKKSRVLNEVNNFHINLIHIISLHVLFVSL